jgi:hypothetical protein
MRRFLLTLLLALPALACDPAERIPTDSTEDGDGVNEVSHEMIVLGDKLEDPYSVSNIEAAVRSVYPEKAGRVDIKATDVYVRFLPRNEEEYDALVNAGLVLMDHPLDYEIVRDGDYYHDPSLSESEITWQYAVVSPDFKYPDGIEYEVLDECYIAENDKTTRADDIDWALVEQEAYRLTGNADLYLPSTRAGSARPQGRITIEDPDCNGGEPVGVAGVRVSCNSFVKFSHAYTDADGYYQINKTYSSKIRYRLVFKNSLGFAIGFNLLLVPASTSAMGKNSPEGVDLHITSSSERKLFCRAVVNNAAYEYITKCSAEGMTIKAPPTTTRFWLFQEIGSSSSPMLQQGTFLSSGAIASLLDKYLGAYKELLKIFLPDITLGLDGADDYRTIYARTCHELAHASHFAQVGKTYWDKFIIYILTSYVSSEKVYGNGDEENAGYCEVGEMWGYYMENMMYRDRYGDDSFARGTSYWFYPQILMYLDERGMNRSMIFKALTQDVRDRDALQTKLQSLYPENDSIIEEAFARYPKQ